MPIVIDRAKPRKRPTKPKPVQAIGACPVVVERLPRRHRKRLAMVLPDDPAADARVAAFFAKMGLTRTARR